MAGRERLSNRTVQATRNAALPDYDRAAVTPGIVHIGVGNFHRAHQAVYVDRCLSAGQTDWGIVGTSLRSSATRDALAPQDCLYAVVERDSEDEKARIVGSILDLTVAPEGPAALVARMADPAIRIVSITVTEKAYLRNAAGGLDLDHPDLVHDLSNPDRPTTMHGLIAAALVARRTASIAPFTLLCCDNLPANGETLRRLTLEFADAVGGGLRAYVENEVAFPSTMVDRIVPATTDADRDRVTERLGLEDAWPVLTEPFIQWVVEDRFGLGRPRWEAQGVTMVDDVRPYEDMKLRLLNGAHSGIAYLGLLSEYDVVFEAFAAPLIRRFVDILWSEAAETLSPELDAKAYTQALAKRFANTAVRHRCAQIALDGSQKLPQRIFATARERLAQGKSVEALMLVPAAWIAACEARGSTLEAGLFSDPLDNRLAQIFARAEGAEATVAAVFEAAGFTEAGTGDPLVATAARHLQNLRNRGAAATLAAVGSKE